LFERAEVTTQEVVLFVLWYGVVLVVILFYLWWKTWGRTGEDDDFSTLRVMLITWFLLFVLYARGALAIRLKEIARRDGITPKVLIAQVESPIQTTRERVVMAVMIMVTTAFGCYGLWWWKFARDGQVTADDLSYIKVVVAVWIFGFVVCVIQGISGEKNMRRQLEARRRRAESLHQKTDEGDTRQTKTE
jgi:hypothetical protein